MTDSHDRRNRRRFLQAGCAATSLLTGAVATANNAGRRVRRGMIDCQSHLYPPEMVQRMEGRTTEPFVYAKNGDRFVKMGDWHRRILPKHSDINAKLADMDANGIERTALSINDPGPEWFGSEGPEVAQLCNDYIASVVAQHPTRFFGLCVLPLQDMPAAREELDRCVRKLGMKGILLYSNLAGRFPDEPQFRDLFAQAESLDIPILLHPALPVTSPVVKDYEMISGLGNMFENTIALNRIILSGILDQHPKLKLVCPHLGGTLPYIIGRVDHQVAVLKRGPRNLKRAPSEYLKQIYFDIVSPLPAAMKFACDYLGTDRLLFASDHPWVDPRLILDSLAAVGLSSSEEDLILSGNARKLFRLS